MQLPKTIKTLFDTAINSGLFDKLIGQLNKDLNLANIANPISKSSSPEQLKIQLEQLILRLLNEDYESYLKLLYIIDVPEHKLKRLNGGDFRELSEQLCFQVLLREWQKVWYKMHYS